MFCLELKEIVPLKTPSKRVHHESDSDSPPPTPHKGTPISPSDSTPRMLCLQQRRTIRASQPGALRKSVLRRSVPRDTPGGSPRVSFLDGTQRRVSAAASVIFTPKPAQNQSDICRRPRRQSMDHSPPPSPKGGLQERGGASGDSPIQLSSSVEGTDSSEDGPLVSSDVDADLPSPLESISTIESADPEPLEGFPEGVFIKDTGKVDPHNPQTLDACLASLPHPLNHYASIVAFDFELPEMAPGMTLNLDGHIFNVSHVIGEGAYARVYLAVVEVADENHTFVSMLPEVAIKYETPTPCCWEMYVCAELHERLKAAKHLYNVRRSIIKFHRSFIFPNGSLIVSNYVEHGTLLDLVNSYRMNKISYIPEPIAFCIAYELLHILEKLHSCHIIHADIKPDNLLILG
ncbi:unnamed protein product, partial [Cyprideis torosa]